MAEQIGQLSEAEFNEMYESCAHKGIKLSEGTAWTIKHWNSKTRNYWRQHEDRSWTNYDCRTSS